MLTAVERTAECTPSFLSPPKIREYPQAGLPDRL